MKNFLSPLLFLIISLPVIAQWSQKSDLPGTERNEAIGFSIGSKGYVGLGRNVFIPYVYYQDFWEYDPANNTWLQKEYFPAAGRISTVGFSIGDKGYVCGGIGGQPGNLTWFSDLWEYNPAADTWLQKANFPGTVRSGAAGFAVNGKGYIVSGNGFNDVWEYNPETDTWVQKANFPGVARVNATGFSLGTNGYVGIGQDVIYMNYLNDFWQYNPATDSWTEKADFAGGSRALAVGFSIGSKGYVGTGVNAQFIYNDMWEYNDTDNTWIQVDSIPAYPRFMAAGFSIGSNGYVATGQYSLSVLSKELWEYNSAISSVSVKDAANPVFLFPNPARNYVFVHLQSPSEVYLLNMNNQIMVTINSKTRIVRIDLTTMAKGIYIMKVKTKESIIPLKLIKE